MTENSLPGPIPDGQARARAVLATRLRAALLESDRPQPVTIANGELNEYAPTWPASFTKGLPHDEWGIVEPVSLRMFVSAINAAPGAADAAFRVPLGPSKAASHYRPSGYDADPAHTAVEEFHTRTGPAPDDEPSVRNWESPRAGHVSDLEGPDAGGVAMPPAPRLGSSELTAELAEVFAMAILRDTSFHQIESAPDDPVPKPSDATQAFPDVTVSQVVSALNRLAWFTPDASVASSYGDLANPAPAPGELSDLEERRRLARTSEPDDPDADVQPLSPSTLFRGSVPGAKTGPYISQFLLLGNPARDLEPPTDGKVWGYQETPSTKRQRNYAPSKEARLIAPAWSATGDAADVDDGYIVYGAQRIDQRVLPHAPFRDYMTDWRLWLDVQNGADVRNTDAYRREGLRFITTPRDLATYVHFDQLYQAYLNACLLLLAFGTPFDSGFPSGAYHPTRGSFATFGGPHILSLMTEVASRALKAVRRQKFNHHLRARPEALAAVLTLEQNGQGGRLGESASTHALTMCDELKASGLLDWVAGLNAYQNEARKRDEEWYPRLEDESCGTDWLQQNSLLPMAFPEGSPMHPAYGAGHATVAGACTTILKAFFEMYGPERLPERDPLGECELPDFGRCEWWATERRMSDLGPEDRPFLKHVYRAPDVGDAKLEPVEHCAPSDLTIQGELNKLAANIAIGRNMAGVHYYTDYYDSLRMGERVAVGLLQEQMLTYPEPVAMRLESFDGDRILIETTGDRQTATVRIRKPNADRWQDFTEEWWTRHVSEFQSNAP
ncbi:hypothetical protein [Maioricimonas sp. JC845]|uniref:hypothetical protein n=1 Tax=Maioricimonas sp. JC845 TaxID=3232138 RepID=UPI003458931F